MLNRGERMCRFNCISIPGITNHIRTCLRCTFFNYIMFEMFVDRSQTSYQYAENSIKGNNRIITNVVVKRTRIETLFILFDNVADLRVVIGCYFIISNVSEQQYLKYFISVHMGTAYSCNYVQHILCPAVYCVKQNSVFTLAFNIHLFKFALWTRCGRILLHSA